jgi:hypothetical protein
MLNLPFAPLKSDGPIIVRNILTSTLLQILSTSAKEERRAKTKNISKNQLPVLLCGTTNHHLQLLSIYPSPNIYRQTTRLPSASPTLPSTLHTI